MCTSPKLYVPCPYVRVRDVHRSGFGYNRRNEAFILDLQNRTCVDTIVNLYATTPDGCVSEEVKKIPCGYCQDCRLEYAKEWAQRCMAEASQWQENYFVTLTYSEENLLPLYDYCVSRKTGDVGVYPSLRKEDMAKFMKDLRSALDYHYGVSNVRFYGCGEYGSKGGRPHMHLLLFNCPLPDVRVVTNIKGEKYMQSDFLEKVWKKGFVHIGEVTWDSASYVARYMLKKSKGTSEKEYLMYCSSLGASPQINEFTNGSRKPGIGFGFFDDNKEAIYKYDQVLLPNGFVCKPNKYYDRLFDKLDADRLVEVKEQREKTASLKALQKNYGLTVEEIKKNDKVAHQIRDRKLKKLVREL